jgi:thymidylate kinase
LNKQRREHPLRVLGYWLGTLGRAIKRVAQPTGIMVVFLGPDGSGKSSVIDRVERDLAPAFRRTAQYRLRPGRRKSGGTPVTDPHGRPLRGTASSLAKLAFWFVDYTLGYLGRTFPQLVRSTFILFDRYYQDLLVDPRRYRYGGPMSLARLVDRIIPRPHLFVVLDAPPEVLYTRKQEIPFEEAVRQRGEYLKLAGNLPNGHLVDASKPLDEVVAETEQIILSHMAGRTARRLKLGARR